VNQEGKGIKQNDQIVWKMMKMVVHAHVPHLLLGSIMIALNLHHHPLQIL
jgi:hypothetical protein